MIAKFIAGIIILTILITAQPINAANAQEYLASGMQKTESGKFREAIMDFDKVIQLDPNQAKAYQYRGVAKAKYGDFAGAIIDYDNAIEKDSNNTDSYSSR